MTIYDRDEEEYERKLEVLAAPDRSINEFFGIPSVISSNSESPFHIIISEREALQIIRTLKEFGANPNRPLEAQVLKQADQTIAKLVAYKLRYAN